MPSGSGKKGNVNPATVELRKQQSNRDKALARQKNGLLNWHPLPPTASMRSIPKQLQSQQNLFTKGAMKNFQFAPRGHGYYDAFVQTPETAVVSSTVGPATLVSGYSSDTIIGNAMVTGSHTLTAGGTANHTGNSTLVVFNPGSSDHTIAHVFQIAQDGPNLVVSEQKITCAQFQEFGPTITQHAHPIANLDGNYDVAHPSPARRIESIPLRGSLRMRNISAALEVGGLIRVMRYNGGLALNRDEDGGSDNPSVPVLENILQISEMIRDCDRTMTFSGHEMCKIQQSNCYPADFVRSMTFHTDTSFYEAMRTPSMCSILVLIDNYVSATTGKNNTYEFNFRVQRAARFAPGSLLHSMARSLKVDKHPADEHDKPAMEPLSQGGKTILRA